MKPLMYHFLMIIALSGESMAQEKQVQIIVPSGVDSISYDQGKLMIVSVSKEKVPSLSVSTCWMMTRYMDVSPKVSKTSFPKDLYKLFDPKATLRRFVAGFRYYGGWSRPDTVDFKYLDTVTVRSLWRMPWFAKFAENVQAPEVLGVMISIAGWKDSVYAPVYDDPNNDGRALYKLHIQLVPGANVIYFGAPDQREHAVEYHTTFTTEYKAIEDRDYRFHNSEMEQSCTTCHDGLPSADNGKTMKAECTVCHKTFEGATHLHAPVEMKECASCHTWSATKKMVVTKKTVPELCYDCHTEKKSLLDSAAVQHPVASDCLSCHSPHGTDTKHQLKVDTYTLCGACHEKYSINHPVGRHPVRFSRIGTTGEEITCSSCHNPHGSPNEALLRAGGGRMMICLQCHDK